MAPSDRLAYSTKSPDQPGRRQDRPPTKNRKPEAPPVRSHLDPGTVYVERTRKGRRGKTVTLVLNAPGGESERKALLKALKSECGAGGALKEDVLEIQGDQRQRIVARLEQMGHRVKLRGG